MLLLKKINVFRSLKFFKNKIIRIKDFPEAISIGLAWGASVSVTPLLGLHIIICFLGTYIMKGNLLAAAAGTVLGNPWTFPFFFYLGFEIGCLFYEPDIDIFEFKISFFTKNFEELFIPTLIGSIPIAILIWLITYKVCKFFLKRNKKWRDFK